MLLQPNVFVLTIGEHCGAEYVLLPATKHVLAICSTVQQMPPGEFSLPVMDSNHQPFG